MKNCECRWEKWNCGVKWLTEAWLSDSNQASYNKRGLLNEGKRAKILRSTGHQITLHCQ